MYKRRNIENKKNVHCEMQEKLGKIIENGFLCNAHKVMT